MKDINIKEDIKETKGVFLTFDEKKELITLEHKCRMEQLEYARKTMMIQHENMKEVERIRSAGINRSLEKQMWLKQQREWDGRKEVGV